MSRGLMQAGIRMINPTSVWDARGLEAIGRTSYMTFLGLRWSVGLMAVARRMGPPVPLDSILIGVSEVLQDLLDSWLVSHGQRLYRN